MTFVESAPLVSAHQPKIETPLMRQYLTIKQRYADAVLLFQLGDFYEMFFDDAILGSRVLSLTLTSRHKDNPQPIPMCGVPVHAVRGYIKKLLDAGHRVAVCDQLENPQAGKGVVRRDVTQVITPGVVLDTDHLDAQANNYLVAVGEFGDQFVLAAVDLSTAEASSTCLQPLGAIADEIIRLGAKEIIGEADLLKRLQAEMRAENLTFRAVEISDDTASQSQSVAFAAVEQNMGQHAIQVLVTAVRYAQETQPSRPLPQFRVVPYAPHQYLQMDRATLRNLEILCNASDQSRRGTLLSAVDRTATAMGARMLRRWLSQPSRDLATIERRQDAVAGLIEKATIRRRLRESLGRVADLERLTTRVAMGLATPRELHRLGSSLIELAQIDRILAELPRDADRQPSMEPLGSLADLGARVLDTLVTDPPIVSGEGGIIRAGIDTALDSLLEICNGGRSAILAMEARERQRTGISSLKIKFNRVFGYTIEVTKTHSRNVPDDYQRKQTLANAERFTTPELLTYETQVLSADERRIQLEQELFFRLRDDVALAAPRLWNIASRVAELDVTCSFAEVADEKGYVRPRIDESVCTELRGSRHPVVEAMLPPGQFVPNDIDLDQAAGRLLIVTGPNMAGKSTVMRQVALITVLAQAGSFVPCAQARIGLADRIFTRVGASDNLAAGESTFMVEMKETANILRHATSRSLVVVDEIGRGTATYDGISIAWAVAEYLHDTTQARTLFATHYHELCALPDVKPHARNANVAVREWNDDVIFLYTLCPGAASRSYGIEVARLAGIHPQVLTRAKQVLAGLEAKNLTS